METNILLAFILTILTGWALYAYFFRCYLTELENRCNELERKNGIIKDQISTMENDIRILMQLRKEFFAVISEKEKKK